MDQGWAAVLGALAGALATGGSAYLTAKATTDMHKRQARREVYKDFLLDIRVLQRRIRTLRSALKVRLEHDFPQDELDDLRKDITELCESLERHYVAVALEGPSGLAHDARIASRHAARFGWSLSSWVTNPQDSPASLDSQEGWFKARSDELDSYIVRFEKKARRRI